MEYKRTRFLVFELSLLTTVWNSLLGVDVNTCDNAGWSPLHEACNLGHLEIVRELLNFIPAKTMDHFLGQGNRYCVIIVPVYWYSVYSLYVECIHTVFTFCRACYLCIDTVLLLVGGDKKPKKVNLLVATEDQITPLHDAVMNNRLEIAKLLLQHGGTYAYMNTDNFVCIY